MQTFAAPETVPAPDLSQFFAVRQPDGSYKSDHPAYEAADAKYREDIAAWAKSQGAHPLAGEFISTPMGDGSAEYVLAKINGKLSLIHLPLGDAWHDDRFCRLMTVAEAKLMVEQAKNFREFWAKRTATVTT